MGPLFSLILMAIASSIAVLVAYIVARFLYSPGQAFLPADCCVEAQPCGSVSTRAPSGDEFLNPHIQLRRSSICRGHLR